MYLSRKIIKIFLRITSYPSFFPDTVLELPIDCTRTASLIPAPAPDLFSASVSESLQKIFSTNHTGALAYAALQVTQLHLYFSSTRIPRRIKSSVAFAICSGLSFIPVSSQYWTIPTQPEMMKAE